MESQTIVDTESCRTSLASNILTNQGKSIMSRVLIAVMGYSCDRCAHQWVPRRNGRDPVVCPRCKSPYWNRPKRSETTYDQFRKAVVKALRKADKPLTWTEIRRSSRLPQLFPNNHWVQRMERDDSVISRERDPRGVIAWRLPDTSGK